MIDDYYNETDPNAIIDDNFGGEQEISEDPGFNYFIDQDACSCMDGDCLQQKSLLQLKTVEVPIIKIEQVLMIRGGFAFSQDFLWDMFNLKELGNALATVPENNEEIPVVEAEGPWGVIGQTPFHMKLVLKNTSNVVTGISFVWKKFCDCKRKEVQTGYNIYQMNFDHCVHRLIFMVKPMFVTLQPGDMKVLNIALEYLSEGENVIGYEISLSHGRKVCFKVRTTVFPLVTPVVIPMLFKRKSGKWIARLHPTSLRDTTPAIQYIWLRNPFNSPADYTVEVVTPNNVLYVISEVGQLPPSSTMPLLLLIKLFHEQKYEILLKLTSGDMSFEILVLVEGSSLRSALQHAFLAPTPLPNVTYPTMLPVSISHIRAAFVLLCHGYQETIIHMRNMTGKCIHYKWEKCIVSGIMYTKVSPADGYIPPFRTLTFRVKVISLGPPSVLSASLGCSISVPVQEVDWHMNGFFIITDKGEFTPEAPKKKEPTEYRIALGINARILNCCTSIPGLICCREPYCIPGLYNKIPLGPYRPKERIVIRERDLLYYLEIVCGIFDRILWDVANCGLLKRIITNLQTECLPFYSQLRSQVDVEEFHQPLPVLPNIIQKLLFDCLHDAFEFVEKMRYCDCMGQYPCDRDSCEPLATQNLLSENNSSEHSRQVYF